MGAVRQAFEALRAGATPAKPGQREVIPQRRGRVGKEIVEVGLQMADQGRIQPLLLLVIAALHRSSQQLEHADARLEALGLARAKLEFLFEPCDLLAQTLGPSGCDQRLKFGDFDIEVADLRLLGLDPAPQARDPVA